MLRGALRLKQGDAGGFDDLQSSIGGFRRTGFRLRWASYLGTLAEGLGEAGQLAQAHAAVDEAIEWSEREERWYPVKLLPIKGELFRREAEPKAIEMAADCYLRALDWVRKQEALSWELRITTSLARLKRRRGKLDEACELLSSVYDRFTEGFETADLREARTLMNDLRAATR